MVERQKDRRRCLEGLGRENNCEMESRGVKRKPQMNSYSDSAAELVERIKRKAPAYLDLLTAETDDEFEAAFVVILEGAIHHLEKNKKNFASLGEEGLSGALAGTLSVPGLTVTQETNSNGHVDLTIEADH